MNILSRLKNLFKLGELLSVDDSGNIQVGTAKYLGKKQQIVLFTPYGLMNNPPVGSVTCVGDQLAQASNGIGVADNPQTRPLKDLKEGEVAVGNYLTGDYTKYDEDGTVTTKTAGNTIVSQADGRVEIKHTATDSRFVVSATSGNLFMRFDADNYLEVSATGIKVVGDFIVDKTGSTVEHDAGSGPVNIGVNHKHSGVTTGAGNTGNPI